MKRLALTLLLTTPAYAHAPAEFDNAWKIACRISEYSCEGLEQPFVELMWRRDYRGGYAGDSIIHFNPQYPKDRVDFMTTLIHEYSHYIDYMKGGISYSSQKDICDSENRSYTLVNEWLESVGREDLQIHNWWEDQPGHRGYWKCLPWYPGVEDFVVGEPEFSDGS